MTTQRLYFDDAYATRFEARIVSAVEHDGVSDVVLDRTLFYPEGGGQPADHGTLGGQAVVDVQVEGGEIRHRTEGAAPPAGSSVEGVVAFDRRFDHMQQHTGQHLLSSLFASRFGASTVSFHLGRSSATIDIARASLTPDEVVAVEEDAARVIRAASPVVPTLHEDPSTVPPGLRKEAEVAGPLRIVTIGDVDACPCGGTHVQSTAEIESVVIVGQERVKDGLHRVEFLCGGRARRDHRAKLVLARALVRSLSVEERELAGASERLVERLRAAEKTVRAQNRELVPVRAEALMAGAVSVGDRRLLIAALDAPAEGEKGDLAALATTLERRGDVCALLVQPGAKLAVACVTPAGAGIDATACLRAVISEVGGAGGGGPTFAQGGVPDAGAGEAVLARGRVVLTDALQVNSAGG